MWLTSFCDMFSGLRRVKKQVSEVSLGAQNSAWADVRFAEWVVCGVNCFGGQTCYIAWLRYCRCDMMWWFFNVFHHLVIFGVDTLGTPDRDREHSGFVGNAVTPNHEVGSSQLRWGLQIFPQQQVQKSLLKLMSSLYFPGLWAEDRRPGYPGDSKIMVLVTGT